MQTQQERLVLLVDELEKFTHSHWDISCDELVHTFGSQFWYFTHTFQKNLHEWSALDEGIIGKLKAGDTNYLLDLALIDQLTALLLDEFGHDLQPTELVYVRHTRELYEQIHALINEVIERPQDAPLSTKLDSPVVREKLSIEFDRLLCTPVHQMIEGVQHLLANNNLNDLQRQDLQTTLRSSRRLHRLLQTARPMIETKNFRALAMLSHEYRTPFCGLTGFFVVLLEHENEGLSNLQLDQLRDLISYRRTVLGMVNNLVDATKILSGKDRDTSVEVIESESVVQSMKKFVEHIERKYPQVSVQIQTAQKLPSIYVDEFDLRLSLHNLLENAYKYTPQGSICLDAVQQGEFVVFRVQDTGIGIPQDQHERIFEPFTQVGEQSKGLGLGLFLARRYVEMVRGSLTVESQVGVGSTFTLKVPVAH
jgi:signal transduction histidine kinase